MITYVRGKLVAKSPTSAVVEVGGDPGGIGYEVAISLITFEKLPELGAESRLLTHHYVREDRQELFGFADEGEREIFELLIGVSGIGPNSAQTILSGMSVEALREAIFYERVNELTAIKGIGKKTAERMVVELKDKIQAPALQGDTTTENTPAAGEGVAVEEAVLALIALGFAAPAARRALAQVVKKSGADQSVQQLIRQALKER
ncbi:MAG: Holliday junction branch migration protein RuvA [Gemmatimonadetes bacterium]|nr:Holliday junction branch migration protein RuvA [Gemmatimonadota bacterium]